jgi:hypothetical protein
MTIDTGAYALVTTQASRNMPDLGESHTSYIYAMFYTAKNCNVIEFDHNTQ